ncbi:MAG: sigma-70 family RNA polymerase sigma factor [Polyangia bacterium]
MASAGDEAQVRAVAERGRSAWPGVAVSTDAFEAYLRERAGDDAQEYLEGVHAEDLYLACGVAAHDPAALAALETKHLSQVALHVVRVTIAHDVVDEVRQILRERLLLDSGRGARITDYEGRGPLGGWLRISAVRIALNVLRARRPEVEVRDEPDLALDPELAYVKAHTQQLFHDTFSQVIGALEVKARTLLRLHYVEAMTMDQLARMYQTSRSSVARQIDDVRRQLLVSTERKLQEDHRLSRSEVASVIRDAQSRFESTLSGFLKER